MERPDKPSAADGRSPLEEGTPPKPPAFPSIATAKLEETMYEPLAQIMEFTRAFFQKNGVTGDDAWPQPINPLITCGSSSTAIPQSTDPLQRAFVSCYNKKLRFAEARIADSPPDLKLDLAMLLIGPEGRKHTDPVFWRDVRVAIEVKHKDAFDSRLVTQVSRYARAVKLDQFDRNLSFTLAIGRNHCRIFRWDTAACYVTSPLDYQRNPSKFMELIGRLASLDPTTLGYDPNFSNAGLVVSSWRKKPEHMRTVLTIRPTPVRFNLNKPIEDSETSATKDVKSSEVRHFCLDPNTVAMAQDGNFSRGTVVWRAMEVIKGKVQDKVFIVKQNHQDDARPHEGVFHERVDAISIEDGADLGVARMVCSQELGSTRAYHKALLPHVEGYYTFVPSKNPKPTKARRREAAPVDPLFPGRRKLPAPRSVTDSTASKATVGGSIDLCQLGALAGADPDGQWRLNKGEIEPNFERVLLRFVFEDAGEELSTASSAEMLINAVHDCLKAMHRLFTAGILHRDISFGNLLIHEHKERMRGCVIDLGLAVFINEEGLAANDAGPRHHHLTGTLPFIATDLLGEYRPDHQWCHDIESLFWVLLWTCLKSSHADDKRAQRMLAALETHDSGILESHKIATLSKFRLIEVSGPFSKATVFLRHFAKLCHEKDRRDFVSVNALFEAFNANTLEDIPSMDGPPKTPPPRAIPDDISREAFGSQHEVEKDELSEGRASSVEREQTSEVTGCKRRRGITQPGRDIKRAAAGLKRVEDVRPM
ncbi:hypothetical protein FRB95_003178 [Tulasnella sp. JGI-2019a]|nr:hypothetical protein FRB93_005049 [Tulasnella sp. JGI-2019a]KAG9031067.1 hypothetical protein FRB95_003178 [Tulasnella sp. JGI-2019a]